mmetsp:Transcript_8868/g.1229  ORF Transcript_8868/g.1229 Transcript_8868/m.1229 type:complete len:108 (+) Transcript_8868:460-783(+)
MMNFTHFWHWFPLVHFFNLSLSPSAIIGVNSDFRIPKNFQFKSNAKPLLTDYIPHIKKDDDKKDSKKETANLSITNRAKARAQLKNNIKDHDKINESSLRKGMSSIR